jgi:hypothetical protein
MKYLFLILFAFLWYLGFSKDLSKWLFEKRITEDDYRYGDLYRLSNLAQFRVPVEKCVSTKINKTPNVSLILLGDSFTEKGRIDSSNVKSENFQRFFIADTSFTKIDKSKKNILIIETVERHFRERFAKPYKILRTTSPLHTFPKEKKKENNLLQKALAYEVPYNTERHEMVLFSSDLALTFKEWKAWINWKLFSRIDEKVVLSKDSKHILYYLDAQPSGITSNFDEISDDEINILVQNVNETYNYYKNLGFDEIYLSMIPNKTSILGTDLGEYNHLIERIQQNKALKMPCLDVYTPMKHSKTLLYDIGDTHWNCQGKQIWIDEVNHKL